MIPLKCGTPYHHLFLICTTIWQRQYQHARGYMSTFGYGIVITHRSDFKTRNTKAGKGASASKEGSILKRSFVSLNLARTRRKYIGTPKGMLLIRSDRHNDRIDSDSIPVCAWLTPNLNKTAAGAGERASVQPWLEAELAGVLLCWLRVRTVRGPTE